jgi:hypothetical protein
MTRLILAAGVAALAIASAAAAKPPGGGGGGGNPHGGGNGGGAPQAAPGGGGGGGHGHGGGGGGSGGGAAPVFTGGGGGGHGHGGGGGGGGFAPMFAGGGGGGHGHGGGGGFAPMFAGGGGGGHGHGGGSAAPQMRAQHQQARGVERQQVRQQARGFDRQQARGVERQQAHQQARGVERQQAHQQVRGVDRQQAHQQVRGVDRQQAQSNRALQGQQQALNPQFSGGERFNGKQAKFADRQLAQNVDPATYRSLTYANNVAVAPAYQVQRFVGAPVSQVTNFVGLSALPASVQYLYPDTPAYYYQYGDGYLYQVDRTSSLISALIPLLAGGYLPGQYLPQSYMGSYVPDYYGMNSFYPDYGNTCNRYANGVIYEVDCATGFVENVIPMYAGGYGVGQILPSAYSYYNVPMQYRTMYYDTPDYGYWYSPGAIYQYDQRSSMITSVAALMAPGFTVGQQLPLGYDAYNVPYDYRATYYDTPNASYRYNNGYIYQVDPATQLVTAIVASLLT